MIENPQDPEVKGSLDDKLTALVLAVFLAALSFFAMMFVIAAFSTTGLAYRRFGDEGSAWLGVSIGLPLSLVVAIIAFVATLRWRLKKNLEN